MSAQKFASEKNYQKCHTRVQMMLSHQATHNNKVLAQNVPLAAGYHTAFFTHPGIPLDGYPSGYPFTQQDLTGAGVFLKLCCSHTNRQETVCDGR